MSMLRMYPVYNVTFTVKDPSDPNSNITVQTGMRVFDLKSLHATCVAARSMTFGRVPLKSWQLSYDKVRTVFRGKPGPNFVVGLSGEFDLWSCPLFTRVTSGLEHYFEPRKELQAVFRRGLSTDELSESGYELIRRVFDTAIGDDPESDSGLEL